MENFNTFPWFGKQTLTWLKVVPLLSSTETKKKAKKYKNFVISSCTTRSESQVFVTTNTWIFSRFRSITHTHTHLTYDINTCSTGGYHSSFRNLPPSSRHYFLAAFEGNLKYFHHYCFSAYFKYVAGNLSFRQSVLCSLCVCVCKS